MLGSRDLKEVIEITESTVECPVRNCDEKVPRQRKVFRRQEQFKCPKHGIYISPSTFEYQDELDNILWQAPDDLDLFRQVKSVKRESRIGRDNSEDAVTWNVFRFLQKAKLLPELLMKLFGSPGRICEPMFWGYSEQEEDVWSSLHQARHTFETKAKLGSEPDLIVSCDKTLYFIEAKLASGNNTSLTSKNPHIKEKFLNGGNRWYSKVFDADFETVAIMQKKYELLRFWLLGTWIASALDLDFFLVNLVLSERERDIEDVFKPLIKESGRRKFLRMTWEDIYQFILNSQISSDERDIIITYFDEKTLGYDAEGRLRKAFSI